MNRPVIWEARETPGKVLVVWEAVWAAQVWRDDEVPEEEGRGRHQVDSPEEEGEEDLKMNRWWSLSSEGGRLYITASSVRKDRIAELQMLAWDKM